MSVKLSWYLEKRVMLLTTHGESSGQDMLDLDQPIIDYLNQSNAALVHLIIDQTNAPPQLPSQVAEQIKVATQLKWPKHPRYGWAIMIGRLNPMQRFVAMVATNFFKARQRAFDTMEEGLDFLNEVDSTLPDLRSNKLDKAS